ncbi:MAG TPA: hypothetical protein VFI31_15180 [Pirellulales bacterium]|nr:hypothetical protein [Pirellulales bacterium]
MHFRNKLALRTAQKYMRLAKNWPQLAAQCPAEPSSQQQAAKAITAILSGDEGDQPRSSVRARAQVGASARGKSAQVGANASAPDDVPGPVWRASGPFVREALKLVTALETSLNGLVARGYPLESEAERAQEALDRLRAMFNGELDEAGALQAAGEWSFVTDNVPPATSAQPRKEVEDDRDN